MASKATTRGSRVFRLVGGRLRGNNATEHSAEHTEHPEEVAALPPSEDEIRHLAYEKWCQAGHPTGDGVQFWLDAERELAHHSE